MLGSILICAIFISIALILSILLARNQLHNDAPPSDGDPSGNTITLSVSETSADEVTIHCPESSYATHECLFDVSLIEPTCTTEGYKHFTCVCGNSYSEKYAEKSPHVFSIFASLSATCTSTGYNSYICDCGESYTEETPILNHIYNENLIPATCTENGYSNFSCICGDSYTVVIQAMGHNYSSTVIPATCTQNGSTDYQCICGDSYSIAIEATGHSYSSNIISATCTSDGYTEYICSCGDSYSIKTADKTGHLYSLSAEIPSTCTVAGYSEFTCICGDSYTEESALIAHIYQETLIPASCTENGRSDYLCVCGDSYSIVIKSTGHKYSLNTVPATCTSEGSVTHTCFCGSTYSETLDKLEHLYTKSTVPATCTKEGASTFSCVCGDSYTVAIAATGHSYSQKTTNPTCTSGGYTTHSCKCGYSYRDNYTPIIDHKWSAWTVSIEATTISSGSQYRKCSVCSKRETLQIPQKLAVDLDSITPISIFSGINSRAMKAINAVLDCVDKYYDTDYNDEIYLGKFELTPEDVNIAESALVFYFGSYYDGLKSNTFYYIDENHQHLFVSLGILRRIESERREMMDSLYATLRLFEAGNNEYLINQAFTYLAKNIAYDSQQSDATVALKTGYGSCNTYPILFKLMLCRLGIENDICIGYSYKGSYHAWNRVLVGGEWLYYDLTFYISTNSKKYYAATSLAHDLRAVNRYLTN